MIALRKIDYESLGDCELARRIATHDALAAGLVVRRNNQRLFRVAHGILKNRAEAEDAVQSGYLNAFAAIGHFNARASLSTWLTRIVINEALGRDRAARRRRALLDSDAVAVIEDYREKLMRGSIQARPADAEIARAELRAVLESAIAALPGEFRLTFILREIEGLSVEETADAIGIPPATVKTRYLRARRRLQQMIDPEIRTALRGTFPFAGHDCETLTERVLAGFARIRIQPQGDRTDD